MLLRAVCLGFVAITMVSLTACGTLFSGTGNTSREAILNYHLSGHAGACKSALSYAYQRYNKTKQQVRQPDLYMDWHKIDDKLAEAVAAQQHQDYQLCVHRANEVVQSIERNQRYNHWKSSIKP